MKDRGKGEKVARKYDKGMKVREIEGERDKERERERKSIVCARVFLRDSWKGQTVGRPVTRLFP